MIVIFEEWDTIFTTTAGKKLSYFPTVVIAVPCWNEEKTVEKTLVSLLALNYPKEKIEFWVVNDGSKDNTLKVINDFKSKDTYNQIKIIDKENGGKHTAVNYVLDNMNPKTEIFGCLDADSFVFPDTLQNMLLSFEDKEVMAVTPMLIVRKPKNVLQAIQSVEYNFGLLLKRIFSAINGIHVTPGPFSLYRKEVFDKIGGFKNAHNTEDMELTFRMQKNFMKIVSGIDAYVETSTPDTVYKLYKQRLRWTQGFMGNSIDYKDILFRPKYGNVAMLTIPLGWIGIIMVLYMSSYWLYSLFNFLRNIFYNWQAIGLDIFTLSFSWSTFFTNIFLETGTINLIAIPVLVSGLIFIVTGHYMSLMDSRKSRYILYFLFLWVFLVPLWFAKAAYNTLFKRANQWR